MIKKAFLLFSALIFFTNLTFGQGNISDTTKTLPYISISYQYFFAGGDLDKIYGPGNMVGGDFNVKLRSNFEIGIGGAYIFGNIIRQDSLLHGMQTGSGAILDEDAVAADVFFQQRGWKTGITFSKIFSVIGPNPNSGIKLGLGFGYSQHWIRIENQENTIPQLSDEYKSYYDRKVGGVYLEEFLGYQLFSNKGFVNFIAGFEFRQGFSSPLRTYNIDDMDFVSGNHLDLYYGIKVSWNIIFHKRMSTSYYIN
jgi:hypothetical protein